MDAHFLAFLLDHSPAYSLATAGGVAEYALWRLGSRSLPAGGPWLLIGEAGPVGQV